MPAKSRARASASSSLNQISALGNSQVTGRGTLLVGAFILHNQRLCGMTKIYDLV